MLTLPFQIAAVINYERDLDETFSHRRCRLHRLRQIITNTQDEVVNLDKLTYAGNFESLAESSGNERCTFE